MCTLAVVLIFVVFASLRLIIVLNTFPMYDPHVASLDAGFADDFIAHRVLLSAGIFGIENLSAEINHVPSIGASLQVLPLKLKGGSGAPARVVAFTRKMKM